MSLRFDFTVSVTVLFLLNGWLLLKVACESTFAMGTRFSGDQLLLKDVADSRMSGKHQQIDFNYKLPKPLTYIAFETGQDIAAEVMFSCQDNRIVGTIIANQPDKSSGDGADATTETVSNADAPFKVLIIMYGYNDTWTNGANAGALQFLIKADQRYSGIMSSSDEDDNYDDEDAYAEEQSELDDLENATQQAEGEELATADVSDEDDLDDNDKVIELGHRQEGDHLIYETYQTSRITPEVGNHTVTFYYIDSNFITYVRFVIFDHFAEKASTAEDYIPPLAEYTHFSPSSLKATITDSNRTSIFVQMFLYGYAPNTVPADYVPFLPVAQWRRPPESPSAVRRLKEHLNKHLDSASVQPDTDSDEQKSLLERTYKLAVQAASS